MIKSSKKIWKRKRWIRTSMWKLLMTSKFNRLQQLTKKHKLAKKESKRCLPKRRHPTKSFCRSKVITSKKPLTNCKLNLRNSRNSKNNVNSPRQTFRLNLRLNRRPRTSCPQINLMTVIPIQSTTHKKFLRSKFLRTQPMLRSNRNHKC